MGKRVSWGPKKKVAPDVPKAVSAPPQFMRGDRLSIDEDAERVVEGFEEILDMKQRLFLQALSVTPQIGRACRAAGIHPSTAWSWRFKEPDPLFVRAYARAYKMGLEHVEDEMFRRGHVGYAKPVYHQGRLVGTERQFSDTAAIFMLKGAMPEKYRERIEQSGPGGGPIQVQTVDPDTLTDAQLLERIEFVKRSLAEPVKQMAEQAVQDKVNELAAEPTEMQRYAEALAKRNGNGNGNGNGH